MLLVTFQGDGGDPLVNDGQLIGILNFHLRNKTYAPSIYANVRMYINFIHGVMAETKKKSLLKISADY